MKKIIALVLAVVLAASCMFVMASCGDSKNNSSSKKEEAKELHMATNAEFPPYEYMEKNKIVGIDPDIAQAISHKLGYKLVIDNMQFDAIIAAVTSGKADFGMAGMTVTDERKEAVDFTDTYATTTQVIIVRDKDSKVASADDLEGSAIGVQLGTTGDIFASDVKDAKIQRFSKGADAVEALSTGKIDAVIIDSEPAKEFVKAKEGLKILDDPFAEEEYAICLKKGSDLTAEFNKALKELKKDGSLEKIVNKYIGD